MGFLLRALLCALPLASANRQPGTLHPLEDPPQHDNINNLEDLTNNINAGALEAIRGTPDTNGQVNSHVKLNLPDDYDKYQPPFIPTDVTMTVVAMRYYQINEEDQTIEVDAHMYLRWTDPRIEVEKLKGKTSGDANEGGGEYWLGLDPREIWNPSILFENQQPGSEIPFDDKNVECWFEVNKSEVLWAERLSLNLVQNMDFSRYPFDWQEIMVKAQSFRHTSKQINLKIAPNAGLIAYPFESTTWKLKAVTSEVVRRQTMEGWPNDMYVGRLVLEREIFSPMVELCLPTILITYFSLCATRVGPEDTDMRLTISTIGMLTIMAFITVVNESLPDVGYFTWMLELTLASFIVCFLVTVVIVGVYFMSPGEDVWNEIEKLKMKQVKDDENDENDEAEKGLLSGEGDAAEGEKTITWRQFRKLGKVYQIEDFDAKAVTAKMDRLVTVDTYVGNFVWVVYTIFLIAAFTRQLVSDPYADLMHNKILEFDGEGLFDN